MKITQNDIATIEQMHDCLLENELIVIGSSLSNRSRRLTSKLQSYMEKENEIDKLMKMAERLEDKYNLSITVNFTDNE